ncbi:YaiI/YqxD family protein [Bartonella sp. B39]
MLVDARSVKPEIYRVMSRYQLKTFVMANHFLFLSDEELLERVIVAENFDCVDNWIVEHVHEASIVITSDIPLAARVVRAGGVCLSPTGRIFDASSVGHVLAMCNLMEDLRGQGKVTADPRPFCREDCFAFLSALDLDIQCLKRCGY